MKKMKNNNNSNNNNNNNNNNKKSLCSQARKAHGFCHDRHQSKTSLTAALLFSNLGTNYSKSQYPFLVFYMWATDMSLIIIIHVQSSLKWCTLRQADYSEFKRQDDIFRNAILHDKLEFNKFNPKVVPYPSILHTRIWSEAFMPLLSKVTAFEFNT